MAGAEETLEQLAHQVWERTTELMFAPLNQQDMLWTAIPLLIATLFMTLYFGRYRKEELGWNTAFGNTMVFLFVAISIIRKMYEQGGDSFENLYSSNLYIALSLGLIGGSIFLMFFTYFHLLPKRLAFFLFSAPPINVSVYVVMAIVYASLPADHLTLLAGVVFLIIILLIGKMLQFFLGLMGLEYKAKLAEIGLPKGIVKRMEEFDAGADEEPSGKRN